jgi:hypothetical protein
MTTTHHMRIADRLTAAQRKAIKSAAAMYDIEVRTQTHGRLGSSLLLGSEDIGDLMDMGDVAIDLGAVAITFESVERTIVDPVIGSYRERRFNSGTYTGRGVIA